eukprot:Polyplicarium_translucidae@DN903_c0_g1_i2.p5
MSNWALVSLGLAPTPLLILARMPQAYRNYAQGHTGRLSLLSQLMMVSGNLARIATTLAQVSDFAMLAGHVGAAMINGLLLAQIIYYWKETSRKLKEKKSA